MFIVQGHLPTIRSHTKLSKEQCIWPKRAQIESNGMQTNNMVRHYQLQDVFFHQRVALIDDYRKKHSIGRITYAVYRIKIVWHIWLDYIC